MKRDFKLPDVGEGLTEAEIVRWHVAVGDTVKVNQIVVEIETAKAVVELPSPYEGEVAAILAAEGETVDVGRVIITVDDATEEALTESLVPEEPQKREPVLVGYGVKQGPSKRRARKGHTGSGIPAPAPAPEKPAPVQPAPVPARPGSNGSAHRVAVLAKPPVRKLAKDLGVDLADVAPTGPNGSITRDDVLAAQVAPVVPLVVEEQELIPVRGVRKATAAAMVASAFTAPHVTEFLQVDVTETMNAVRRLREQPDFAGVKVSPLLLVAKALVTAMKRHPHANSTWTDEAIILKKSVNLGIAAATERGLIVPNVKDAQALSLVDLARALNDLTDRARAGKCTPAEMSGGTVTITNVGVFGIDAGTPILNPGESAILAFGQIRDMPWVVDGQIAVRKVTTLALSFDHRVIDGELGSYVLRDVGAMLEDPLRMLAWA
ncbi:dihydrolipoamide acetyltransferase family protein [Herbidospora sp. NBRC 101105]|uniref:dihydrolipoamide acetyltransferase family protein n=1 Tax=Herbidospora sp. NBRC 101105 TaxID=3032195 RepID=UPI0024A2E4A6|nr:dihydrolipoamide acetyltransferase family protein [Herbidospora sp. NBRC 101105]GLX95504.1 dihydrolipoamide acetyltransferase component of pyruvate dehydrogenase complex [Herbidospora sp. NBRC 101105]